MEYLPFIFSLLFWPILIIGLIIFFVVRSRRKKNQSQDGYLQVTLSKEDTVSQLFLLLSLISLGVTLLAFNRDFGEPISWRLIIFITSVLGLIGTYYFKTIYTLLFSLIGMAVWWQAQAGQWVDEKHIKSAVIFAGSSFLALLCFSLGHLHEKQIKFKRFALVYMVLGIISVTGSLFLFSTKSGVGMIGEMTRGASFFTSGGLVFFLFVLLISLIGVTLYAVKEKLLSPFEGGAVLALAFLFGITAILPEQNMFVLQSGQEYGFSASRDLSGTGIFWALIYNVAIFFELLGLIFSGYMRRETWLINLGALFLFLLIIVKYFDWMFAFLDKSIFFIGAGILLFAVGWFMEKGRRYMISNIKEQIV